MPVLLVAALIASTVPATPRIVLAANDTYWDDNSSVFSCGPLSCSLYLGRQTTKNVAARVARYNNTSNAAIGLASGGACFAAGVTAWASLACSGVGAVYGGWAIDQTLAAEQQGVCMRLW